MRHTSFIRKGLTVLSDYMVNKILFLVEKYCEGNPSYGPTIMEGIIAGAIESTGLVRQTKHFYFDVLTKQLGRDRMTELFLEDCAVYQPDLIIYSRCMDLEPPKEVLREVVSNLGIKILSVFVDAKPFSRLEVEILPFVSHVGVIDNIAAFLCHKQFKNIILMYAAVNPSVFYNKELNRDIDVSFLGSVDPHDCKWPMRSEYTRFLRDNGINVFLGGGQATAVNKLPVEDYSNILNRSKMSIDFCRDGDKIPCLKFRVFEIMSCGSLMLEDWDSEASYFFELGKDFVTYHSKRELLDLIRYYLKHEDERQAIAHSGYTKVTKVYNAKNMWGYTFERMGFSIPDNLAKDANYILHKSIMEKLYD